MGSEESRERFDSAVITCVMATAIIWGVLNWRWEYCAVAHSWGQPSQMMDVNVSPFAFIGCEKIRAGFPLQYWLQDPDDAVGAFAQWSPVAFALDVTLGVIVVVLAGWIAYRISSHRKPEQAAPTPRGVRYRIAAFSALFVALLIVASFAYKRNEQERAIEAELSQHAIVVSYAVIPKPLAGMTPKPLLASFARIRAVILCRKSTELIATAVAIPTLHTIGTVGETPSVEQIKQLGQGGRLKHLLIRGAKIDQETKRAIFQASSLRRLDLVRCRGVEDGWHQIHHLSHLKVLDLVESDVRLSLLPETNWPATLTDMNLSRPRSGTDSLKLRGLKSLTNLRLQRADSALNRELLQINLEELPHLEFLGLETAQRISLSIKSAPRLKSIGFLEQESMMRSGVADAIPSSLWLRELHLDGVQSLSELNCDGLDLKSVSLKRVPNLKRLSMGRHGYRSGYTLRRVTSATPVSLQSLLNSLGKCDGPPSLDLSSLPLSGVDLTPLAENKKIRRLELVDCGIDGKQTATLAKLSGLTDLDLRRCPIDDDDAARLLSMNPNLRSLLVSSQGFSRIEVVDRASLQGFVATESLNARVVKIENSPHLEAELILGDSLQTLQVQNGRALKGLSVNGPLPSESRLEGLRSLKFFAVGGPNADDDLCRDIWRCAELDHLTVAYGNLSKQALQFVGRFELLTTLALPGSELDDEVVANHWQPLTMLSDIDLSETKISSQTILFVAGLKNLQKLAIAYCNVKPEDLEALTEVGQLIELDIAGIGIKPECLKGCLRRGMLDRLDLSDSQLSPELIDILASPAANSLMFVGFKNCNISDAALNRIAKSHPRLAFDVTGVPLEQETISALKAQNRLLARTDRDGFLRHLSSGQNYDMDIIKAELDPVRGRIDYNQFANHQMVEAP